MADLISRKALVTKLSQGYWDRNLQQGKNDPCVIDAMIDWAIRQVKEVPSSNPWHTGTPTEEGEYLIAFRGAGIEYGWATWDGIAWDINMVDWRDYNEILAWQKITPYVEED